MYKETLRRSRVLRTKRPGHLTWKDRRVVVQEKPCDDSRSLDDRKRRQVAEVPAKPISFGIALRKQLRKERRRAWPHVDDFA